MLYINNYQNLCNFYYCTIILFCIFFLMLGFLLLFCIYPILSFHNILQYGAIPRKDTIQAQTINSVAITKAIYAANSSDDRIVVFPKDTFYIFPVKVSHLVNISMFIEGKVVASKSFKNWPGDYTDLFLIQNSDGITIRGGGKIDGRGYHWWMLMLLNKLKYGRPNIFYFKKTKNILMHDLILKNSPCYHVQLDDVMNLVMYNIDIKVNTTAQFNLIKHFSIEGVIPMFPFNTDGIDPSGIDMHIYNITCQNWDDVIVPKPNKRGDMFSDCTENILVENITVRLGVGMSIGSVPPRSQINCVRNVTFRNVYMDRPFKGIYIKSNPGDDGSGLVENIIYQNITMKAPIWWAIYIGPQQMKEPDGGGPGCMLYPFDPKGTCQTQPRVTFQNITLQNVLISDSLLYPITIRCNVSNPCRNFVFDNVTTDHWIIGQKSAGVVCEYATGIQKNSNPSVYCLFDQTAKTKYKDQLQKQQNKIQLSLKDIKVMWQRLQTAVRMVPYQQQDDEMMSDEQILSIVQSLSNNSQI